MTPTTIATGSYEQHRAYVLSVLARRCPWVGAADREAVLHDAYAVLLEKGRAGTLDVPAMRPEQVRAYLTQTAINKALTERDRAHTRRSVALGGDDDVSDDGPSVEEVLGAAADSARLREIVAELPERQQVVVALRYFHDRTPADVRSYLGITDRAYRRELERAMRTLSARMEEVRDGSFCDSRRSLILAYVAGIAGPNRMRDARRHLASCPGCTAWARELREAAQQAGAFVPLPLLAGAAGGLGDEDGHRLFALGRGLRDLLGAWRDHATGLATRADPATGSMLGAVRPGAVAAVVAGCIGVGSTATYCAFEGLPAPLGGGHHATVKPPAREAAQPAPPRRIATPAATTAAASTPTTTTSTKKINATNKARARSKAAAAKARRRAAARRVARATAPEFGVEGTGTATPAAATATPRTSSPAPSGSTSTGNGGWGQEFGP